MAQTPLFTPPSEQDTLKPNGPQSRTATLTVSAAARKPLRKEKRVRPDHCLNCGRHPLTTRFCADCGQENTPHAISVAHLAGDVMDEFMKWDGRLFRSLALLLFFPGKLTQEYNAGRRVNYVSPFKMYFVVSAIFVFLLSWNRPPDDIILDGAGARLGTKSGNKSPLQINFGPDADTGSKSKGKSAKGAEEEKDALLFLGEYAFPPHYALTGGGKVTQGHFAEAYRQWQQDKKNKNKHPAWRQNIVSNVCHAVDAPQTYIGNLIQSIGKAMFFLLPLYAFLLAMFFFRSRRYYVEHLILAINNHTMAFLIGSMADISIRFIPHVGAPVGGLLIFSYWLYELISLRVVYQRGWLGTMFRQGLIWFGYAIALVLGFAVTAVITLMLPS